MTNRMCCIVGCERPYRCTGYCEVHYRRWRKHGDPHYLNPYQVARALDPETYFLSKVTELPSGCWQWSGRVHKGYGVFMISRINAFAHRWAYEHWVGSVPAAQHLDHYRYPQDGCIGPTCCNPQHVRPASPRENTLRGDTVSARNLAKTHCWRGHEFTAENTRIKRSSRVCRVCQNICAQQRRVRMRAAARVEV